MDVRELAEQARDMITVRRVFGDPIERDGLVIIPVAEVGGGGGGGGGKGVDERGNEGGGSGGGFGLTARPVGVYVIRDGHVHWEPVFDLNRVIKGAQAVAVVGLLTLRTYLRHRRQRRR
jgi:uncharacterized spore protein YtfJ